MFVLGAFRRWSDIPPKRRLAIAGDWGLSVGKGCRAKGGVSENVAFRMMCDGLVILVKDEHANIVHVLPRQLSFSFINEERILPC